MSTSSSSSETMCTSTDDCFCQEQVRHSRSPCSAYAQRSTSSADMASRSGAGATATPGASSGRGRLAKQDLLERVPAQAETQRLERDDLVRWDVAEVHVGAELLHE